MMVDCMEKMKSQTWQRGWLLPVQGGGVPINISGRAYSGLNPFMLLMYSAIKGYKVPVFMTFNQVQKLDSHVLKGEKSFPVLYFQPLYKDEFGNKVDIEDINKMSEEEKSRLTYIPLVKVNNVFNIEQTNLAETKPDLYAKIMDRFKPQQFSDTEGMYENDKLDALVANNLWVCPIKADKTSAQAYYHPGDDYIVVPEKAQFRKGESSVDTYISGQEYYGTMLHEMAHSTGHPSRLNRLENGHFGSPKYAREELIAELTSAFVASALGFDTRLSSNSACYLNSWIDALKEEPRFIMSVLPAVGKASDMIIAHIDSIKIGMGERPTAAFDFLSLPMDNVPFKNVGIVRGSTGEFNLRASIGDTHLGMKPVSETEARIYASLKDPEEKRLYQSELCKKVFAPELERLNTTVNKQTCHMAV